MKLGKKLLGTTIIPLLVLAVCLVIGKINGVDLFDSQLSWTTFVRAITNVTLVTFALSLK